jgi:CHAT domain-containing protein
MRMTGEGTGRDPVPRNRTVISGANKHKNPASVLTVIPMLLPLSLVVLMTAVPVEVEPFVSAFVYGLRRDDRVAVRGIYPQRHSYGTSYDRLHLLDDVRIEWYRVHSSAMGDKSVFVTVEMEGNATVANTGERVPWPRWWSLQLEPAGAGGRWIMTTAMTLERRLVAWNVGRTPAELSALLREHREIDIWPFLYALADHVTLPGNQNCETVLWILREGQARGRADIEAVAYRSLSQLALIDPIDTAAAIDTGERAVLLAEAGGTPDAIAENLFYLGKAYANAGRVDDALTVLRRAATYYDRMFDPRRANHALGMASDLEISRNNFRAALADAELYQKMIGRLASQHDRMIAAFRIAEIHDRLGNIDISRRHYEKARAEALAKHDPEWQLILANKVALQARASDPAEARRILGAEARPLFKHVVEPKLIVITLTTLAAIQRETGDTDSAEDSLAEALALTAKTIPADVMAAAYVERSLLRLAQGRFEEALADARRAREKTGSAAVEALTAEGRALRQLGRRDDAEAVLRAAIDLTEDELRQRPLDETGSAAVLKAKLVPHRELLDLLVDEGCAREALMVAERMRARSLREALRHGRADLSAGLDETKRARERELEQAIADVNRRLLSADGTAEVARLRGERDEARLALRRFRTELQAVHPHLDRGRPETGVRDDGWQPAVAPGELVLELAVNDDDTFLFILEGGEVAVHRLGIGRDALDRRISAFVASLEQRDLAYRRRARDLYDLLLGRADARIASAASLRIVPDGPAWRLPFHALIDERGRHLIDRVPVAYSPSVVRTSSGPRRGGARRALLAFGDPAVRSETANMTRSLYRNVSLGRLPEAATEARAIARLYGDARVRVGADARETAFKDDAWAYRVLHLAAHSIVDDHAPMFSSIVLAASGNNPLEDGLLEAREIAALDLRADLAVLSACETARGAVTAGEGVVGLSWAFLAAGVPTTVVSQWKVGSASTAGLMIRFHRELRGGRAIAEALRSSMLELRRDPRWQHPFYWAPFVVIENSGIPSKRQ